MGQDRTVYEEIETKESSRFSEVNFSHIVTFWGVKCLYSEDENLLLPIGRVRKALVAFFTKIHIFLSDISCAMMPGFEPAFPLRIIGVITKQEVSRI